MPPTTAAELREIYARTLSSTGLDPEVLDTRLWDCDLEVVPRVIGDERHWRASVHGTAEARLLDAEDLLRELAFLLLRHPDEPIAVRTADAEEVAAYLLLGGEGLTGLDQRRQRRAATDADPPDQMPVDDAMSLAALINRVRDDIEDGDHLAYELGVEHHERVDVRYDDVEALLRVAERLEREQIIDVSEADGIIERALAHADGG